ncbi:putative endopeptidase [Pilibacter termitis]|uniref:Putative endopeptidase n=1 Tax=Pilibacter termitis TaxID=263852 RepID=A0A1T4NQM0_9ENTE|nr:M13-type metalloendopeptidase [Pilibacter termitis]SJZ81514.1 putative endopeptidase [Pilibacter termitis]
MEAKKVRIQDDLYEAVNGEVIAKLEIPADKVATGGFQQLVDDNEKLLMEEFAPMLDGSVEIPAELSEFIKFYKKAGDFATRDALGFEPVKENLERIEQATDFDKWKKNLAEWILKGFATPFAIDVDPDFKNTDKNCLWLSSPHLILPDNSYYLEEKKEERERLLDSFRAMMSKLLVMYGKSEEEAEKMIALALKFDAKIAPLANTSEESHQVEKLYNPISLKEIGEKWSTIPLKEMLSNLVGEEIKDEEIVIDYTLRFTEKFTEIVNAEHFEEISAWMFVEELRSSTNYLSEEIRQIGGEYSRALSGIAEARSQEKHAFDLATNTFSQVVGLYYGHKYFGEDAKADVKRMVEKMIDVYKSRLQQNNWLTKETIEKAIVKLNNLGVFVGFPDKLEEIFTKFIVDEEKNLVENTLYFSSLLRAKKWTDYTQPVDREKWHMPAHQVNAYFNPTANHIVFPAAILQAPFYSTKQTSSQNYGGIGAVIAHEISHAFDNNGAQFDERGNMNNWWREEDFSAFKEKQKLMIAEFDGAKVPAGVANGELTVSENIADLGGLRAALTAALSEEDASLEEFWKNWATIWCRKARLEYETMLLSIDPHAPARLRVNLQAQNFAEFHDTFGVKSGDGMWREEEERVSIW